MMAPPLSQSWSTLPRSTKSECPKLFYNISTKQDNLEIKLTDLVAIWECSLDRQGIIEAAKDQRSSIDPSESNAQLRVLLEKLEQSIASGDNYLFRADDQDAQKVYLRTDLNLPRPLKPLSWTFELLPQDASELAEQLLRPCLHEASVAKQKLESLLRVIKDKDHVLSRLLEKIDSSAPDLSLIFPGITGLKSRKGRVTVREAQKHVPGMAVFDLEKWSHGFENGSPYAGFDQSGMSNLVAGCEKCPKHTVEQHNDWLKGLPLRESKSEVSSPNLKRLVKRKKSEASHEETSTDTESDFERQPTPQHMQGAKTATRNLAQPYSQASFEVPNDEDSRPAKKPKLGKIGGPRGQDRSIQALREPSNIPERNDRSTKQLRPTGTEKQTSRNTQFKSDSETATASEAEDSTKQSSTKLTKRTLSLPRPSNKTRRPLKVGKTASHSPEPRSSSPRTSSPAHGNSRNSSSEPQHSESSAPSHSRSKSQPQSPPGHPGKLNTLRNKKGSQRTRLKDDRNTASDTDTGNDIAATRTDQTTSSNKTTEVHMSTHNNKRPDSPAKPPTPRKLGRLNKHQRSLSHDTDDAKVISEDNTKPKPPGQPHPDESETETDSDLEPNSPGARNRSAPDHREQDQDRDQQNADKHPTRTPSHHTSSTSTPNPEPPPDPETPEAAANRRREELKHRINAGGGAGRKKRKF